MFSGGGMIIAAGILSAGMIIAANIVMERKPWLPSKDELKMMAEDFTPGSLSDLTDNNFEGAKNLFNDLIKHAHISAHHDTEFAAFLTTKCTAFLDAFDAAVHSAVVATIDTTDERTVESTQHTAVGPTEWCSHGPAINGAIFTAVS